MSKIKNLFRRSIHINSTQIHDNTKRLSLDNNYFNSLPNTPVSSLSSIHIGSLPVLIIPETELVHIHCPVHAYWQYLTIQQQKSVEYPIGKPIRLHGPCNMCGAT